jgi:hypothetical protein
MQRRREGFGASISMVARQVRVSSPAQLEISGTLSLPIQPKPLRAFARSEVAPISDLAETAASNSFPGEILPSTVVRCEVKRRSP